MKTSLTTYGSHVSFLSDCSYVFLACIICLIAIVICYNEAATIIQEIEVPNPDYNELLSTLRHVNG